MGQRHQDRFDLGRDLRKTTRPGSLFQGKLQTSEYKAPPGPNDRRPARVQGCHDVFVFLAFACQKQNVGSFDFSCSSLSCSGHLKQPFLFRLAQFNYVFLGHHPLLPGWRSLAYFTCQNLFVEVLAGFMGKFKYSLDNWLAPSANIRQGFLEIRERIAVADQMAQIDTTLNHQLNG